MSLSERQARFIRRSVDRGRFRNASEVIRAGLRLLEEQEQQEKFKLQALRRIAKEAFDQIDRGEFESVDPGSLDEFIAKVDARARASNSR